MPQADKLPDSRLAVPRVVASSGQKHPEGDGPRKLVRPHLPEHLGRSATAPRRLQGSAPLAAHEGQSPTGRGVRDAGHAESFYLQKQMQMQTVLMFVLEDGEQIQGTVEWFDRDSIKVRSQTRMLIFKRSIKYLYKVGGDSSS